MPVEVKRTLVKSPPELWAELSDPASLARHLGEFGEVRTVRTQPETAIEWEAADVRGIVEIKPSGWGTRVTLSVVRERPEPEPEAETTEPEQELQEPEAAAAEPKAAEPEPKAQEPEPKAVEPDPVEPDVAEPEPAPAPRVGLFARLFRRRRTKPKPKPEPLAPELPAEPQATVEPEPEATVEPEPAVEPEPLAEPEPARDLAAELAAVEEAMAEQDAALLTAVLDRLGAAHHRPFSRG